MFAKHKYKIFALVLVLAIAGGGVFFYMKKKAEKKDEQQPKEPLLATAPIATNSKTEVNKTATQERTAPN